MTEPSINYLPGDSITRRIREFPPVTTDEQFENFQKLMAKMFDQIQNKYIGRREIDIVDAELNMIYPWAYFTHYKGHLLIDWNRDYLDQRNLCVDAYGKVQRKP